MVSITRENTNQIAIQIIGNTILESSGYQEEGNTTNSKTKLPNNIRI